MASGEHLPRRGAEAALLGAAIAGYEADLDLARARFHASAARGRPEVPKEIGRAVELRYRGQEYLFRVARLDRRRFRLEVDGLRLEVLADRPGRTGRTIARGERSWRVAIATQGDRQLVEVDGIPHRIERESGEVVRAPGPAVVVALAVQEGDEVAAGAPVAVLEAMKLETTVIAPRSGRVRRVLARKGSHVGTGAPLLVLAPVAAEDGAAPAAGRRVRFDALVPPADGASDPRRRESLEETLRLMLGYDADLQTVERLVSGASGEMNGADLPREEEILRAFADVSSLFRPQPAEGSDGRHSPEEYLFTYLRDLDTRGAGLPPPFLERLRHALGHYGIQGLDRSPELEESLFRISISQRLPWQVPPVLAILESWLERGDLPAGPGLRELLDRMVADTQGGREPAVHDLAREVRYRVFDRPILLAAREQVYAAAASDLARLAAGPGPEEREELIRALIESTQPLHLILSQRYAGAGKSELLLQSLLEIMVRRFYRIRELGGIESFLVEGQTFGVAGYEHRGSHVHLIATHAGYERLAWSLQTVRRLAGEAPAGAEIVVDLYLWRQGEPLEEEAVAGEIAGLLVRLPMPAGLSRVAVALSGPAGTQHFTFRREADGAFREEQVYRGIHPMLALRLELWRLRNFHLERLPAPDGIYLFHGVARENPRDERLFAVAEVRDLTPVRDEARRIVHLPQLEHRLMEALAGLRRFQARRATAERLAWNRVLLNVWPPVDLRLDEIDSLVRRLAPLTEGVGLEKVAVRCRIRERWRAARPGAGDLRASRRRAWSCASASRRKRRSSRCGSTPRRWWTCAAAASPTPTR